MKALSETLFETFYDVSSRKFHVVNDTLAVLTILSVISIILETVPSFSTYTPLFQTIEWLTVACFTLEYIGRIIAHRENVGAYIFSFFGFVDILAIAPSYIGLTNLTYLKTARVLRILRLLRMVRLAKMARAEGARHRDVDSQLISYRFAVRIYFFALLSSVTVFGTFIYVAEGGAVHFSSIPEGMVWAAKVTMGGVAQHMPATPAGDLLTIATRFTGLALLGLLISIVGTGLRKLLFGTEELAPEPKKRKQRRKKR